MKSYQVLTYKIQCHLVCDILFYCKYISFMAIDKSQDFYVHPTNSYITKLFSKIYFYVQHTIHDSSHTNTQSQIVFKEKLKNISIPWYKILHIYLHSLLYKLFSTDFNFFQYQEIHMNKNHDFIFLLFLAFQNINIFQMGVRDGWAWSARSSQFKNTLD